MSQERINKALATWMGWTDLKRESGIMKAPSGHNTEYDYPPNYTNSLDAVAEVEARLPVILRKEYVSLIAETVSQPLNWDFNTVCATAAQRSEALCRALGLWEDV